MQFIKKRLPASQEIQSVFGFLVFVIFTWSIRGFLYKLSSFMLYYGVGKIIGVLAYMMSFSLMESAIVFLILLAMAVMLPGKWFRDGFSWKAGLIIFALSIGSILLQDSITFRLPSVRILAVGSLIVILSLAGLWLLCLKYQRIRKAVELIMENFSIFMYIYVPLGILSALVVFVRIIF